MSKSKKIAGPKASKKCAVCGAVFTPKSANANYCSNDCYKKAKAARGKAAKKQTKKHKAETAKHQKPVSAPVTKDAAKCKTTPISSPIAISTIEKNANETTNAIMNALSCTARNIFRAVRVLFPNSSHMIIQERGIEIHGLKEESTK